MSCTGLKRKLELEDDARSAAQPKRAPVRTESPSPSYCVQRQTVLQLSMQKLCSVPSLGRRVLIANTLRLVQDQASHQGVLAFSAPAKESGESPSAAGPEASLTPAWLLEQSDAPSLKDGFSSDLTEIEDLGEVALFGSDPRASVTSGSGPQSQTSTPDPDPAHSLWNAGPASSALAFPPDLTLDDFLFSEIDGLLCEFNPYASGFEPGSSSKVVSMVTDDFVMRGLASQPFRTDLNELEHIMDVLVGS